MQRYERIRSLAGLRDHHAERLVAEGRTAVAELRRVRCPGRKADPVLEHVLADHRRVQRGAHAEENDLVQVAQLLIGNIELAKRDQAFVGEPSPHRVGDRLWSLVDLFEHEVGKAALLRLGHVPVDVNDLRLDRHSIERRHFRAQRRDRRHLSLAKHEHALGIGDDRGDV